MSDQIQIDVFPCTDTLLYFPVYLAIDNLSLHFKKPAELPSDQTQDERIWKWPDVTVGNKTATLQVVLHKPNGEAVPSVVEG